METMALAKAKARFSGLIDRLIHLRVQFVITKHGKPVAALVPYEEWEKFQVGISGGLAAAPAPPGNLDEEVDRMVEEIYKARAKSKGRKPPL